MQKSGKELTKRVLASILVAGSLDFMGGGIALAADSIAITGKSIDTSELPVLDLFIPTYLGTNYPLIALQHRGFFM